MRWCCLLARRGVDRRGWPGKEGGLGGLVGQVCLHDPMRTKSTVRSKPGEAFVGRGQPRRAVSADAVAVFGGGGVCAGCCVPPTHPGASSSHHYHHHHPPRPRSLPRPNRIGFGLIWAGIYNPHPPGRPQLPGAHGPPAGGPGAAAVGRHSPVQVGGWVWGWGWVGGGTGMGRG